MEVPTELVSVTETVFSALVSPEKVNGNVSENAPPFAVASVLVATNHDADVLASETVNDVPFNWVPDVAVKVKEALTRSRGVELASRKTWKPLAVTPVILTDPGTMTGARRGTVMVTLGTVTGSGAGWPAAVSDASCTVMVPATVPSCTPGRGTAAVELGGIATVAVVPPVTNCTAVLLNGVGRPAAFGVNVRR